QGGRTRRSNPPIPTLRAIRPLVTRGLLLVALLAAAPAWAQLRVTPPSGTLSLGQHVNVFAHWSGSESLDGFEIEAPEGWAVRSAQAVRDGTGVAVSLRAETRGETRYVLESEEPLQGPHLLVLGLDIGGT